MNANDVDITPTQFEKDMQDLVAKGYMQKTGPGTFAITDKSLAYVDQMNVPALSAQETAELDKLVDGAKVAATETMAKTERSLAGLAAKIEEANTQRRGLINACKAVLMFHRGGPWSEAMRDEWKALTGADEASTRTLCEFVREQLEKAV